ncbi:DUF4157 domain-containing protein [Fulvivirga maritima]|uniref:eCIS core domain-containing protein n=1 Tax=Fulvivirga maritima TaxID=2904247 RepID=UPI001F1B554C|nr:DUF4157 domain-containing protein [Fulvivirga maritima]UII27020.1 DUF4157 domain-containing protein [Fulvivirga maritima]
MITLATTTENCEACPLPDPLRHKLEYISGYYLGDVEIFFNSTKPEAINVAAYAYGNSIFISPGYEYTLAHEAWHVIQQKQGRVTISGINNGVPVNNNLQLEGEACNMATIIEQGYLHPKMQRPVIYKEVYRPVVQCMTFEEAARIVQEKYAIGYVPHATARPDKLYMLMPTDNLEEIIYGERPDLLSSMIFLDKLTNTCIEILEQGQESGYFVIAKPYAYEAREIDLRLLQCCELFSDFKIKYISSCEGFTPTLLWELLKQLFPHLRHMSPDQHWDTPFTDDIDEDPYF